MMNTIVAAAGTLALMASVAQAASADVAVRVNGYAVDFSPAPIVEAGRVFVPLRGVFERLGASVAYDDGTINATGNGRDISLHIGATQATVNGQAEILDVAPFIVGASTFVPLRFVSEALGASVNYDDSDDEVSITLAGAPQAYVPPATTNYENDGDYASYAPPPIPSYAQPVVPEDNEIWQPGYWAWGPYGYYWVPGTWVEAPQTGYLWTPGYWHSDNARYAWSPGFWAIAVGFYGGVNYGSGYYGHGYDGGRWNGRTFVYNTYVTRVNTTIVHNTYVDRTVVINNGDKRAYDGGANGLEARPTARERAVARSKHLQVTAAQIQHVHVAEQDRRLLATVNHNQPPVVAVSRPLRKANPPVGFEPVMPVPHAVVHPISVVRPVETFKPIARPRAVPVMHPVPVYRAPVQTVAPIVRARPIVRPAHVIPPPPRVAPVTRVLVPVQHASGAFRRAPIAPRPASVVQPQVRAPQPAQPGRPREEHRPDGQR